MKAIISLLLLALFPSAIIAQSGTITGTLTDQNGTHLVGANIQISGTEKGTITGAEGNFILEDIPAGKITLRLSYIGYTPEKKTIDIAEGEEHTIDVSLEQSLSMPQITVIGQSPERFARIPGSAASVSRRDIERVQPVSGHEIFRRVSGIHAVEEEGLGLRANIGVRGLDPNKSRSVLMMEDGIPVALAPYGEPEMYYTPPMDRMEGVEVLKGSGSIKYGPQTFGGVINYKTPDPPPEQQADFSLKGGQGRYLNSRLFYGNTIGDAGFNVNIQRRQGNEVGLLDFGLTDLNSKLRLSLNDNSYLGAKFGIYDEQSNSTYVGLSQQMYEEGNHDFTHLAPDDQLHIRRYSASVSHDYYFSPEMQLQTTVYGYTTERNWSRQDFLNTPQEDVEYVRTVGNEDIEGGALYFLETTGNRNRAFDVYGVEPRFNSNFVAGGMNHELDAGVRYLFERAYEQRINGKIINPTSGEIRDDEIRTGRAFSAFLQNRTYLTDELSVTPGLRFEYFDYERDVKRVGFENVDITNNDVTTEWIPGVGINYNYAPESSIFAGVHRGFGPPRVKDAISVGELDDEGLDPSESLILQSEELDAERSWNYELGSRTMLREGIEFELTGFLLDFSNQVIPVAESAAGAGVAGAVGLDNAGATRSIGVETEAMFDLGVILQQQNLPALQFNLTYTDARYNEDRFVENDAGEQINVKDNRLPYSPDWMGTATLIQQFDFGLELNLSGTFTGDQYGDPLNRTEGSLDGRQGKIDSYFVLDGTAQYEFSSIEGLGLTVSVKNLMDERYIASRRPQGIRLGMPRFVTGGITWNF